MSIEQMAILGFVIYMVSMITYSSIRSRRINAWPHVIGKLLNADVEYLHMLERGSAWEDVKYEYKVDGKQYVGTRLSPLVVRGQVGPRIMKQLAKIEYLSNDQVKVFYNKEEPSKSYLVKETWLNIFG